MNTRWSGLAIPGPAILALSTALPTAMSAPPEIFRRETFDTALQRAEEADQLLLVDFTATWCGPCRRMDQQTWPAADVAAWIHAHAIAIQIDVDKERQLARRHRVQAMPTMIVFRDGEELDRVVGFRSAQGLLSWLEGVREGRRHVDALREAAGDETAEGGVDVRARYDLAKSFARSGRPDGRTFRREITRLLRPGSSSARDGGRS